MRIGVLVSGGGTNLQTIIDSIKSGYLTNCEIAIVISDNENAHALRRAADFGVPTLVVKRKNYASVDDFSAAIAEKMRVTKVDIIVMAGFLSIVSGSLLCDFAGRIINIHPSLIPAFCGKGFYGLHVHAAAIERGVKISGATVHYVNEIPDGGEIIAQKAVQVYDNDTPETLQKRVMKEAEREILPLAIKIVQARLKNFE
jgi:phosphoribosylglycinamide formyltransferase-1